MPWACRSNWQRQGSHPDNWLQRPRCDHGSCMSVHMAKGPMSSGDVPCNLTSETPVITSLTPWQRMPFKRKIGKSRVRFEGLGLIRVQMIGPERTALLYTTGHWSRRCEIVFTILLLEFSNTFKSVENNTMTLRVPIPQPQQVSTQDQSCFIHTLIHCPMSLRLHFKVNFILF